MRHVEVNEKTNWTTNYLGQIAALRWILTIGNIHPSGSTRPTDMPRNIALGALGKVAQGNFALLSC